MRPLCPHRGPSPRRRLRRALVACAALASACAPSRPSLDTAAVIRELETRETRPAESLRDALALFDETPLAIEIPASNLAETEAALADPGCDAFWHLRAMAWQPAVRALRRDWRASREAARAAGRPEPFGVTGVAQELDSPETQTDLEATVDVLGLLGLGPRAAARTVATRNASETLGRLEESVWRALFDVDRARVALASERAREAARATILSEARPGLHRMRLLKERGRLTDGILGRAEGTFASLEAEQLATAADIARAAAALARASGLTPTAAALAPSVELLASVDASAIAPDDASQPTPEELLARVPTLRAARLSFALAESRLRAAIAAWWPGLRLGPRLRIRPDDLLLGGLISLEIPWPPSVDARIVLAEEQRDSARERVVDRLLETLANAASLRVERRAALDSLAEIAGTIESGSARAWRAARARLATGETVDIAETWIDALQLRARGAIALTDARERALLAELGHREAIGTAPGLVRDDTAGRDDTAEQDDAAERSRTP